MLAPSAARVGHLEGGTCGISGSGGVQREDQETSLADAAPGPEIGPGTPS